MEEYKINDNDNDNISIDNGNDNWEVAESVAPYGRSALTSSLSSKKARNFRKYPVWQKAVAYATEIYRTTAEMPWFEKKGICDQLQRAVVSISSNIAEGAAKPSDADFARFLDTALGSAYEVETQLTIANNIGYISDELYNHLISTDNEIEQQLGGLIASIRKAGCR